MKSALLHERDGLRTFVIVCEAGDEAMKVLTSFAAEQRLGGSHFTGVGAFERAKVGYFDWPTKTYQPLSIAEQVEVLSIAGDITLDQHERKVHAHVVLGKRDGTAHGGHLLEGYVRPTLEIVLVESPRHLQRRFDPSSGLALIDPDLTGR